MKHIEINIDRVDVFDERWYRKPLKECAKKEGIIHEGYKYLLNVTSWLDVYPKGSGYLEWIKNTKEPDKVRDIAGEKGSLVHNHIEEYLKTGKTDYNPHEPFEVWEKVSYWMQFWNDVKKTKNVTDLQIELMLFDEEIETAGTADLVCNVDGVKTVFDWKTGGIYDTSEIQIATYATIVGAERALLVQLDKKLNKKGYRVTEVKGIPEKFRIFQICQELYRASNSLEPRIINYPLRYE